MKNYFDLSRKVAMVTGASSGLGADAAKAYAECGATVVLLARRVHKLKDVEECIKAAGGRAVPIACDVTDEESVRNAVADAINRLGHIDILLNNAGVAIAGAVDELSEADWDKVVATNLKGMFLMCKHVVPFMKDMGGGKIVNVSSVNAIIGDKVPVLARHAYNASKAGVRGLTLGMAASYGVHGITVNCIGPGLFESEMTQDTLFRNEQFMNAYNTTNPMGRPGRRGELNGTILYLSSEASSYVTGQYIVVDGGASIV